MRWQFGVVFEFKENILPSYAISVPFFPRQDGMCVHLCALSALPRGAFLLPKRGTFSYSVTKGCFL